MRSLFCGFLSLGLAGGALAATPPKAKTKLEQARDRMVDEDIIGQGIKDPRVIAAMRNTPRHEFVPFSEQNSAYWDMSLPIGEHQTISAPFIVAYMTEELSPQPDDKVLEIGTGSGYQAAILSPLCKEVYTIEILEPLGKKGEATLKRLKYDNVHVKIGDGFQGWPEHAPFDRIIVTCSPEKVPQALQDQLKEGGRMIVPVGERYQQVLYLFKKEKGKLVSEALRPTLFVPMTGKAEDQRQVKPDPANPKTYNGSFEELVGDTGIPTAWHYQRQMKVITGDKAPDGKNYIQFKNDISGRPSRLIQGMAIDGRKVHELELSAMVRVQEVRPGQATDELPMVYLQFYDENRAVCGRAVAGPWRGTFDWKKEAEKVRVPGSAREATLHIGLFGAVGEADFDQVEATLIK
ncbi:MAG TPA: protein-L-isoaspartate(D-aspartate) O-methyltransferase [Pirellulales bacterium]|nr:protein-L-isoaspartate(D-aspartate) O-methyltransferase [Pirellulales bacterium]